MNYQSRARTESEEFDAAPTTVNFLLTERVPSMGHFVARRLAFGFVGLVFVSSKNPHNQRSTLISSTLGILSSSSVQRLCVRYESGQLPPKSSLRILSEALVKNWTSLL